MKKVVSAILCVLLILSVSGCGNGKNDTPTENLRAKEWGYFCFPNTDWGITDEELFKALDKKQWDFTFERREEKITAVRNYYTECYIFEEKVTVGFEFTSTITSDIQRLSSTKWGYEKDFTDEKLDDIMNKLDGLFEEQGISVEQEWEVSSSEDGLVTRYDKSSTARKIDLSQEIHEAYNKYVREIYASGKLPPIDGYETADFITVQDTPLSGASIAVLNGKGKAYVTLSGSPVKEILEYAGEAIK